MEKISLTIPGASTQAAPSVIPKELRGGLFDTGKGLIQVSYNYVFLLAIFLAVIFIVFSGIQMIQSGGDPQKLAQARTRLTYAVIGLVVVILAFFIIGAVLKTAGINTKLFFGR